MVDHEMITDHRQECWRCLCGLWTWPWRLSDDLRLAWQRHLGHDGTDIGEDLR